MPFDAETEARIQSAMEEFLPGRRCLIVAQKVASVRHADHIIILREGRIVEQGTHEELLNRGGAYAETYAQQTRALSVA